MDFTGVNWLAVLVAAIAAFAFGAAWYMSLSKPWMKASRIDPLKGERSIVPFVVSFIGLLIMAYVLHVLMGAIAFSGMTVTMGLVTGFIVWLGFMATTMAVNHRYEGFGWDLTLIDGAHWLGVALIMGAIIGWWGADSAPVE
ncbi:MAG: DUF1761 domain-containing protein [Rhizobiaceae bacterium]